jgi:uncharacterized protein (TIGR01319 family)
MMIDIGGATTDVYSLADGYPKQMNAIMSGLEEPYAKRTVEGDLGMRYSALGILQSLSSKDIHKHLKDGIDIVKETQFRHDHIEFLATTEHDDKVEDLLAGQCVDAATSRHVGTITSVYTPLGMMYHQVGKDLTQTQYFIGTGGVVINSNDPISILKNGLFKDEKPTELRPKNPQFMLDKDYILSAMGLLSIDYPEIALRIMKKRIIGI